MKPTTTLIGLALLVASCSQPDIKVTGTGTIADINETVTGRTVMSIKADTGKEYRVATYDKRFQYYCSTGQKVRFEGYAKDMNMTYLRCARVR